MSANLQLKTWQDTQKWLNLLAARAERRRSHFNGGEMQWHIWGAGSPLLLLHGGSGSWTHWCRNVEMLSKRYRIYVPDLPGCGESDSPPFAFDEPPIFEATHRLAQAVVDGFCEITIDESIQQYQLMGFSLGSIVGTVVAGIEQNRIDRLILVGTSALGVAFPGLTGQLRPLNPQASIPNQIADQKHNLGLIMLSTKPIGPRVDHAIDDASGWIQLDNVKRARLRTHILAYSDVMQTALPGIGSDTQVSAIWGSEDIYTRPSLELNTAQLRALCKGASVRVIDGGGHWVVYQCARQFHRLFDRLVG